MKEIAPGTEPELPKEPSIARPSLRYPAGLLNPPAPPTEEEKAAAAEWAAFDQTIERAGQQLREYREKIDAWTKYFRDFERLGEEQATTLLPPRKTSSRG